jgi:hypothetical protein
MNDKIRKFKIEDGKIVMCDNKDFDGEFVHINDIKLMLLEEKKSIENQKSIKEITDDSSEWDKKFAYGLDVKLGLIKSLISKF